MLDRVKDLWNRWKVHVTVVGGALVVASVYGTCTYEPALPGDEPAEEEVSPTEAVEDNVVSEE
jgi:hypothetical protein